ncbi:MAG: metal-dependent hydrolase [Nanoarchaeota archaeon]
MNVLLHFLLNYFVINLIFGNAFNYIFYILLFSIMLDLDHIPYTIRTRKKLISKKFGAESRSRFHELYGLALFSVVLSVLYLFVESMIIYVIGMSVILHYAFDFLLGKSRPFYPFSKKEVSLKILSEKQRAVFEIALTIILGVIFWLSMLR